MADDSFDARVGGFGQSREKLVGQVLGKIREELSKGGHGFLHRAVKDQAARKHGVWA